MSKTPPNASPKSGPAGTRRNPLRVVLGEFEVSLGVLLAVCVLLIAFVGPYVAPNSPLDTLGPPFDFEDGMGLLGTDVLGRDVLSRVLWGGRSLILISIGATLLGYVVGLALGLVTGYKKGWISGLILRGVDLLLAFPPLLFLLLVATGAGKSQIALLIAIAIIHIPSVIRIVRAATMEQTERAFVEAAVIRGESTANILRREILPNIIRPLLADAGLRLTWSILLIASASFLGLGVTPPTPNWALMIAENQSGLSTQPLAVLAPAIPIVAMTFSVNLIIDGLSRRLGVSSSKLELPAKGAA